MLTNGAGNTVFAEERALADPAGIPCAGNSEESSSGTIPKVHYVGQVELSFLAA